MDIDMADTIDMLYEDDDNADVCSQAAINQKARDSQQTGNLFVSNDSNCSSIEQEPCIRPQIPVPYQETDHAGENVQTHSDLANQQQRSHGIKRKRTLSEELVDECALVHPTEDTFMYNGTIVNMNVEGLGGSNSTRSLNRGVINALVLLSRCQNKIKNNLFNRLLDDAKYTIMELQSNNYRGLHKKLPDLVRTLLCAMDSTTNLQNPHFLNQMQPASCVIPKGRYGLERIQYRGMTWCTKNGSEYLEVSFSNPFRLVFFGFTQRGGSNGRDCVTQLPFYGDYMDRAVYEMYDYMYEITNTMARKILEDDRLREQKQNSSATIKSSMFSEHSQAINGLAMIDKGMTKKAKAAEELMCAVKLLKDITFPLKKKPYDIFTTTGNGGNNRDNKAAESMKYLTAVNGEVRQEKEATEDSVFLSSFIRPRILANGVFSLQIYTRIGLVLHDESQTVLTID